MDDASINAKLTGAEEVMEQKNSLDKKVFCSALGYDLGKSGLSTYMNQVIPRIAERFKVDVIISQADLDVAPFKNHPNINFTVIPKVLGMPILNMIWHTFIFPFSKSFREYEFILLPVANRRLFSRYPNKTIGVFHDLSQFHIKNKYGFLRNIYIKYFIPRFLGKMKNLIAISQSTKDDILNFYRIDKNKVHVNHLGYEKNPITPLTKDTTGNIPKNGILYVSRIEHPGKNHLNLIRAYELLPDKIKDKHPLVFVGQDWTGAETVKDEARNSYDKNNIRFLGHLSKLDLERVYSASSMFVFPSFFEGFGLPLLEAMSHNLPIACSNIAPFHEIGGKAVITFSPDNSYDMKTAILKILNDSRLNKTLIERGKENLKRFNWELHIEKLIKLSTVS